MLLTLSRICLLKGFEIWNLHKHAALLTLNRYLPTEGLWNLELTQTCSVSDFEQVFAYWVGLLNLKFTQTCSVTDFEQVFAY